MKATRSSGTAAARDELVQVSARQRRGQPRPKPWTSSSRWQTQGTSFGSLGAGPEGALSHSLSLFLSLSLSLSRSFFFRFFFLSFFFLLSSFLSVFFCSSCYCPSVSKLWCVVMLRVSPRSIFRWCNASEKNHRVPDVFVVRFFFANIAMARLLSQTSLFHRLERVFGRKNARCDRRLRRPT